MLCIKFCLYTYVCDSLHAVSKMKIKFASKNLRPLKFMRSGNEIIKYGSRNGKKGHKFMQIELIFYLKRENLNIRMKFVLDLNKFNEKIRHTMSQIDSKPISF